MDTNSLLSQDLAHLRRYEVHLLRRPNQLEINLNSLSQAQEELLTMIDYLQKTSAPFIILSYIGKTETYLDKQRLEITSVVDGLLEIIRFRRELKTITSSRT